MWDFSTSVAAEFAFFSQKDRKGMECGLKITARRRSFQSLFTRVKKDVGNSFEPSRFLNGNREMIVVGTRVFRGVEELRGRGVFPECMLSDEEGFSSTASSCHERCGKGSCVEGQRFITKF